MKKRNHIANITTIFSILLLFGVRASLLALPMDGSEIDISNNFSLRARARASAGADAREEDAANLQQNRGQGLAVVEAVPALGSSAQAVAEPVAADQGILTLQHFREALEATPNAERFVVITERNGERSIQARRSSGGRRDQNLEILAALRTAIEREQSSEDAALVTEVVGPLNLMTYLNSHLTPARLHEILRRADNLA